MLGEREVGVTCDGMTPIQSKFQEKICFIALIVTLLCLYTSGGRKKVYFENFARSAVL